MAMSAGELIRNVRMSFAQELKLTAGNCSTEQPVLRVRVIGDRASVESVRKYDAVIFHAVRHNSCNILDAAEALSAKGACWMAVSDDKYCAYELKQLRILCNELCLPLIEINSSEYIPTLVDLTYDKLNRAYEEFIEISDILQGLIRMPELYRFYDDILSDYGFFEYSDYCVAVCHFERKIKHCDFQRDITFAAGYIETGLALKNSAAAVMTAGPFLTSSGRSIAYILASAIWQGEWKAYRLCSDMLPERLCFRCTGIMKAVRSGFRNII